MKLIDSSLPTNIANVLLASKHRVKWSCCQYIVTLDDKHTHTNTKNGLPKKTGKKAEFESSSCWPRSFSPASSSSWWAFLSLVLGYWSPWHHDIVPLARSLHQIDMDISVPVAFALSRRPEQLCKCKMRTNFWMLLISHPLLGPLCHNSCNHSIFSRIVAQIFAKQYIFYATNRKQTWHGHRLWTGGTMRPSKIIKHLRSCGPPYCTSNSSAEVRKVAIWSKCAELLDLFVVCLNIRW